MGYSAEIVRRAQARLDSAREDKQSQQRERLAQAYAQVPRLQQIDRELRAIMAQAAQSAFMQSSDGRELMQRAKEQSLALQKERAALLSEHFAPNFLDETPVCEICGGSGYIGTQMCRCLLALCSEEQEKELSVLSGVENHFEDFRLDYYADTVDPEYGASPRQIMSGNLTAVKRFAQTFTGSSGNLLFIGNTGLGKTFLSACVARTVTQRGYSVAYESASHLFDKLEKAKFRPDERTLRECEKFNQCDLLILDDLGTELPGQFVTAALYTLVNDRLLAAKPMLISTNLNIDELPARYSPQIASRLNGSFRKLVFVGKDIRTIKNRG